MQLSKTGDKAGGSEATLLSTSPLSFGLIMQQALDNGSIYSPEVLDITEETAFLLPGGGPRCCRRLSADCSDTQLLHQHPVLSSLDTSGS